MTVNEIEAKTGLDRGTVRFYEAQGLIRPAREANGYRNYSQADLEKLLKVKLLRALNFSVDDILAMDADAGDFPDRLRARVRSLEARQEDLEDAKRVLGLMLSGGERYETLDPVRYLTALEDRTARLAPHASPDPEPPEPARDGPELAGPWRRYFARALDNALWSLLFIFLTEHVFGVPYLDTRGQSLLNACFAIACTLAVEPLMLRLFGATPGKWVLGLEVRDAFTGGRLSYTRALRRTWEVLCWGEGLYFPIFSLVRNLRSYRAARREEALRWEGGSAVTVRTWSPLRGWAYAGCRAAIAALVFLSLAWSLMPPNRGALTPEELAENVNRYIEFDLPRQDVDLAWRLRPDGTWRSAAPENGSDAVIVFPDVTPFEPESVELQVEDGVVTGLRYRQTRESVNGSGGTYYFQIMVRTLTCALVGADPGAARGLLPLRAIEAQTSLDGFEGFTVSLGGWTVTCKTDPGGSQYLGENYLLFAKDGVQYGIELTITR